METSPALPHEVWERTPPEAQAYIRALEARVEALDAGVRAAVAPASEGVSTQGAGKRHGEAA
jgi:hypothetical protein